ncbi:MAG: hypothetical protein CMO28_16285 [Tistrella sp.]|nr:hypothetical protein [Tistrella sp.]
MPNVPQRPRCSNVLRRPPPRWRCPPSDRRLEGQTLRRRAMSNRCDRWTSSLIALVLISIFSAARPDTPFEAGLNVRIDAATATAARQGETSRIRFRIVNDSPAAFHVIGIETPVAREARLVADVGESERNVLESIGVPAGESLDLTTSHLWYETGPLTRDLDAGETFDMTLRFVGGQLTVPVHVHAR